MENIRLLLEQTIVETLAALPGLSDRVCPVVDIHKSTGPLVVYGQKGETQEPELAGDTSLETAIFQLHVLHGTYQDMRQLAETVKTALKQLQGSIHGPLLIELVQTELASPDLYEEKVRLFRRTYEITFYYQIMED